MSFKTLKVKTLFNFTLPGAGFIINGLNQNRNTFYQNYQKSVMLDNAATKCNGHAITGS
jgi:hypothetical protein